MPGGGGGEEEAVDEGEDGDEVEGEGGGERGANEAETDGFGAPYCHEVRLEGNVREEEGSVPRR